MLFDADSTLSARLLKDEKYSAPLAGFPRRSDSAAFGSSTRAKPSLAGMAKAWDCPLVLVRTIGNELPAWVEPVGDGNAVVFLDLILFHKVTSRTWCEGGAFIPVAPIRTCFRALIGGPVLAELSDAAWQELPRADFVVSTDPEDLDVVAQAFAHLASSEGLICFDWADAAAVAGRTALKAARGASAFVPGTGEIAGRRVNRAIQCLAAQGFDGGVFLCQFVSTGDEGQSPLFDVDAMATAALDGGRKSALLTCYLDQRWTGVVLIAFRGDFRKTIATSTNPARLRRLA